MSPRSTRLAAWAAALAALLAALALYLRPEVMVTLADLVWACIP